MTDDEAIDTVREWLARYGAHSVPARVFASIGRVVELAAGNRIQPEPYETGAASTSGEATTRSTR